MTRVEETPESSRPGYGPITDLIITTSTSEDATEVRLRGQLIPETSPQLGAVLAGIIRAGHRHLRLDLQHLSHRSPACVGLLNRVAEETRALGGSLTLTGLTADDVEGFRKFGLHDSIRLTSPRRRPPDPSR
ncbi:MAG TPA: STAS domain-containing protein [Mycobacteriales bacterium]|nr:STAS domain-containing protein [Mycobacteriales bacterium]